jgi:hypothetical protein
MMRRVALAQRQLGAEYGIARNGAMAHRSPRALNPQRRFFIALASWLIGGSAVLSFALGAMIQQYIYKRNRECDA